MSYRPTICPVCDKDARIILVAGVDRIETHTRRDGSGHECPGTGVIADPLLRAAMGLTQIGTTEDGGIVVGPQGWAILQKALQ